MSVEHVEVLVEEPSMEAALRALLPKVLGAVSFDIYPYQCKNELLARLPTRLSGYSRWIKDSWRILVVVDRDDDDCAQLKRTLEDMARASGLKTRIGVEGKPWTVVNRLAIEELESWYFGDWQAVRKAYPRVPATIPMQAKYRDPDAIAGGTWEAFERVLQRAGYFKGGLAKIEAARTIAPHMIPTGNSSRSFQVLNAVLSEMTAA
ncbi:MAG TPA: DUF4276 family protein [Candidatus Deferrimicrobiaceae bacterium]|jgi:hypothetical protein